MRINFRIRRNKCCAPVLLLALLLAHSGCWFTGNGSPTEQFAQANYELSGLIGAALTDVRELLKAKVIKPDPAIKAAEVLNTVNLSHRLFLRRVAERLQKDKDGNDVLVFGPADRDIFIGLLEDLLKTAQQAISDPAITTLDSAARIQIVATLSALTPFIIKLVKLAKKVPQQERTAPALRLQVPPATAANFRLWLPDLNGLAPVTAFDKDLSGLKEMAAEMR